MHAPNFIGLGVEKAGTSWIFACLYEHPEICIPVKEINFFSNKTLWQEGHKEYEAFFKNRCSSTKTKGEFSTSYFYDKAVPSRIQSLYPDIKLIVCLRNPITRAFSNYLNDIKAGTIDASLSFELALKQKAYYIDQGKYRPQFKRYFELFEKSQLKVMLYDDLVKNPLVFIQEIYRFIGVSANFVPPSLNQKINTGRVPSNVGVEKLSNRIASLLQQSKIGEKAWWLIKKSGIPKTIRRFNTQTKNSPAVSIKTQELLVDIFKDDVTYVENLLDRKLDWSLEKKL